MICGLLLLLFMGCDEGTIYPDETPIDSGRTATVTVSFFDLKAWPKKNYLSLSAFGEDKSQPLLAKRISKPTAEGSKLTIKLNDLKAETKTIEIAVISNGQKLIYSYFTYPVEEMKDEIDIPVGDLRLGSFNRVQSQVFDLNCLSCHGTGNGLAGGLDLRDGVAYKSLVNVKAPISEDGKNYVTPGDLNDCYLLDVLENNSRHKDMFNSSGKQEVLGLIQGWILGGALDN